MFKSSHLGHNCVVGLLTFSAAFCLTQTSHGNSLSPEKALNHYAALDDRTSNQYNPHVAADGKGNWLSMWKSPGLSYAYDPGSHLSLASSTTTGTSWGPTVGAPFVSSEVHDYDLVYAGDDKWVVMWIEGPSSDPFSRSLLVSASEDVGQTWSEPIAIRQSPVLVESLILRTDGDSNLLALWGEGSDKVHYTSHSSDYGETWTTPVSVNGIQPAVSVGTGAYALAWSDQDTWLMVYPKSFHLQEGSDAGWVFHGAKSEDNGANWADLGELFMQPDALGTPYRFKDISILANAGRAVIATVGKPRPRSPGTDTSFGIAVYVSDDAQTTFTGPRWIEQPAAGNTTGGNVSLAVDAAGNWLLAAKGDSPFPEPLKLWRTDDPAAEWTLWKQIDQGRAVELATAGAGSEEFVVVAAHYDEAYNKADLDIVSLGTLGDGIWSDPVYVNEGASSDFTKIQDHEVDLASGDNMILAAWISEFTFPPMAYNDFNTKRIMFSRSFDGGRTWAQAWDINGAARNHRTITNLKVRHAGPVTWECTWVVPLDAAYRAVSQDGGLTWSDPEVIGDLPQETKFIADAGNGELIGAITEVALDAGLNLYTLSTYVGVSSDGGVSWHTPTLIHSDTREAANYDSFYRGDPEVISLGGGRIAVLGRHLFIGRDYVTEIQPLKKFHAFLAESTDYGRTWSAPETVTTSTRFDRDSPEYPTPVAASRGRIAIAWSQKGHGAEQDYEIMFRSKHFGSFTAANDWSLYE